jgi:nitroreductase
MDTRLAIASKRDVKTYDGARAVPDDVVERIVDAGRLSGSSKNAQPWTFVIVQDPDRKAALAETVYAPDNVRSAGLVIAVLGKRDYDVGRASQNMFIAAWNDGVGSSPTGVPDPAAAARALGLDEGEGVAIVLTFGYPARTRDPESRSADEWSARANRKPLADVVRRI